MALNWRSGGFAVMGAVLGGITGLVVGEGLAPRLSLPTHNGDHARFAAGSLLAGASLGAIVGVALASSPPAAAAAAATPGAP